jgi:hypothetical protein
MQIAYTLVYKYLHHRCTRVCKSASRLCEGRTVHWLSMQTIQSGV